MVESLTCSICGKLATVHLTQIVDNQMHKLDLCDTCAQKQGLLNSNGFSLSQFVSKAFPNQKTQPAKVKVSICPVCTFTATNLKKEGKLGCDACYTELKSEIQPILTKLCSKRTHVGKQPKRLIETKTLQDSIETLEAQIKSAIEQEDYEAAGTLYAQKQLLMQSASKSNPS